MTVNDTPWIPTGEINTHVNPWADTDRYSLSSGFSNEFLSGLRDATAAIIGPNSFRWIPIDDMRHSLVEIALPTVRIGKRFFHGLVARITIENRRPCCNIVDPWGRMKRGDFSLHPHIGGEHYSLCHNSNDINAMLRSGNYTGAVIEMIGKISTFTLGGEYRIPPGILVCRAADSAWTCSSGRRAQYSCSVCDTGLCSTHAYTCEICRTSACIDCSNEVEVDESCVYDGAEYTAYICTKCFKDGEYQACTQCSMPTSRLTKCSGCGESVGHNCAVYCEYHNTGGGAFCQNCARMDERETGGRWACYECCPTVEDGGLRCEYVGHRQARRTYSNLDLTVMHIEPINTSVSVCTSCQPYARELIGAANILHQMLQREGTTNE